MDEKKSERLLNPHEVAAMLGVSRGYLYRAIKAETIPFVRLSVRCYRFRPSQIAEWLEAREGGVGDLKAMA